MTVIPEPLRAFYKFTFESNGTGGSFQFITFFAMEGGYSGDGSEVGGGNASGAENLTAIAEGIARAFEVHNAPSWDNITVLSIEAVPNALVSLVP